jgi:hypothetical protein
MLVFLHALAAYLWDRAATRLNADTATARFAVGRQPLCATHWNLHSFSPLALLLTLQGFLASWALFRPRLFFVQAINRLAAGFA